MRQIITSYICPPIPFRGCDWEAIFDGDEGDECAPRGFGATEAEARQDLIDNCDDDESLMESGGVDASYRRMMKEARRGELLTGGR